MKKEKNQKREKQKLKKKETEIKQTVEKELDDRHEEGELSEIEKEIKVAVSTKTKQEEKLVESKKDTPQDTSYAVAQAAIIGKLDSEKRKTEKIEEPAAEKITAPEKEVEEKAIPKAKKKSFFGKLLKHREPNVQEQTADEIKQAVETHQIQKAAPIVSVDEEPENMPESKELSSEDIKLAEKFEKDLFMTKREIDLGRITATEEEKEALAIAMTLAKMKEEENQRKIEKETEEAKKREEVRKIFDAIKEVKVKELFKTDGNEKERLSPRLRRMHVSQRGEPKQDEQMAESLFEQIHAREKEEQIPQDSRITNAIYEQIAERSIENQRAETLKHTMHKVRKFKEREGRYPNQEEGEEIAKEISNNFGIEEGTAETNDRKLTPREQHELRKEQAEGSETASGTGIHTIQKSVNVPAEKLSRRELRKLERQKSDEQEAGEQELEEGDDMKIEPMEEEPLTLAEPTALEQNVDEDAPSPEKISNMKVKDLLEKKKSLNLDDVDTKDDEFNLNLEEMDDDVDNVQQEMDTDKNKCPNCKTPTNDLVFCPECGTGFCPHCAKQAKKVGDRIHYTCPSCNYELKVRVR
ncbi:MAG: hypothetical protein V1672_03395 [Candidatus Diapherotrites archaeon]